MFVNDLTITSLETITAFHPTSGAFLWMLDELQNATISNSQETTDITGKQGRLLNSLKRNKAVTISGNNGMVSGGLLATQTGGKFVSKATNIMYPDYMTVRVADGKVTAETTYKAVGTAGNEIESVYVRNADGTRGEKFTQDATAGKGTFAYDPATKTITFADGALADGTEIAANYFRKIQANVLENMSDQYSEKVQLYVDAFAEDKCSNVYRVQFFIPKADFNGNFDITLGDNQTVHAFEARSLAGASCGRVNGSAGALWTYTVFGENAEDID